ncbi:MAG TPA: hypothetical protein PKD64_04400 [Pirellulaceae bacterium]|nr:hypothetical protein [Pirellulaceae bacterium]HMP69639.1 hypothetical protein [Pirellulaceae bacterium]
MSVKLDRTYVAVRRRGTLETFDLATQVMRDHGSRLLGLLFLGALPFALLNGLVLYRWITHENYPAARLILLCLVLLQAPFATALITDYLGSIMFLKRASINKSVRNGFANFLKLFYLHGLLRLGLPGSISFAVLSPEWNEDGTVAYSIFVLVPVLFLALLVRVFRPYVTEVVLLEKPQWARQTNESSFAVRSRYLHMSGVAELVSQAIAFAFFVGLLSLCIGGLFENRNFVLGIANNPMYSVLLFDQLALWIAAGFATVVRFLCYINLRIQQEGWDVELKLRAEGQKIIDSI